MKLLIHQARFGQDQQRGFALLNTTHPEVSRIRTLSSAANLTEYPPDQIQWEPTLRGFAWAEFYVVLRTFPDISPGMRPGRVFSHALLLVENEQITSVADLQLILDHLPVEINKSTTLGPIEVSIPNKPPAPLALTPRLGKLLQTLVLNADTQPIVWAGQQDFQDAVCLAWRIMWPALRQQFRFGVGFSARDVKATTPQLLAVPSLLLSGWHEYPVIKPTDAHSSLNEVERYLIGDDKPTDLALLFAALENYPSRLSDLGSIQAVAPTFSQLAEATLPDLLALASVVATLQPSPTHASDLKQKLVSSLKARITAGGIEELIQVRTFSWQSAFGGIATQLTDATTDRFAAILRSSPTQDLTQLLVRLENDATPSWWSQSIESGIDKTFAAWTPKLVPLVYGLWETATKTAAKLLELLPTRSSIEADLVAQLPLKLNKDAAQTGEHFARIRQWLSLHMRCALQGWPLTTALKAQLAVDTHADSWSALRYAQQTSKAKDFVMAAVELGDDRLVQLAGELCASQPKLLDLIAVDNTGWQRVWLVSLLEEGKEQKNTNKEIVKRAWALLDYLIGGGILIPGLVSALGKTVAADLRRYEKRKDAWQHLLEANQDFLFATAVSVLQDEEPVSSLEQPLITTLTSQAFAQYYLTTHAADLEKVLGYLTRFNVPEAVFSNYLTVFRGAIRSIHSQRLGEQIAIRNWAIVAKQVYGLAKNNATLLPALAECLSLLPLLDKLTAMLMVRHVKKVPVKKQDWWQMLLDGLCEVYPHGPTQDKIWLASGGTEDIIKLTKNGKEQWTDLLHRLQKSPPIPVQDFIATLVHENKYNKTFQLLSDLLRHDS